MLLAIDTATYCASIALHDGIMIRGEYTWEAANRHTVTLVPHIREMLKEAGRDVKDLEAIAVCVGPGSYTGVRIGVAVAKGLALAQRLPLVDCTTLEIVTAAQSPDPRPLYAFFTAGRRRVGYARFRWDISAWRAESEVALATWPEFAEKIEEPSLVVGEVSREGVKALDAIHELVELPPPAWRLRRAGFLADLAWERLRQGVSGDPVHVNPVYVR